MPLRFKRRVRVLPGIYLNLGLNGVSTTIGPRGANVNIGKQGVYLNTALLGTGLSYRQRIFNGGEQSPTVQSCESNTPTLIGECCPESVQDIVTSEGLIGLQEHLENAKSDRALLVLDIKDAEEKLKSSQVELHLLKNPLFGKLFANKKKIDNQEVQVNENAKVLSELNEHFEDSKADINVQFTPEIEGQYVQLSNSFSQIMSSEMIWDISSETEVIELKKSAKFTVERQSVKFDVTHLDFIKSKYPAFHLKNANGSSLYIYPAFILRMDTQGEITLVDLQEFNIEFNQQRFLEPKSTLPSDAKVVDYTWDKVNKDGSRDMRLKDNYQIPVVVYGAFNFSYRGEMREKFYISDVYKAQHFSNEFNKYLDLLKKVPVQSDHGKISTRFAKEFYDLLEDFSNQLNVTAKKLVKDDVLIEVVKDTLNGSTPEKCIRACMIHDVWKMLKILCKHQYVEESVSVTGATLLSNVLIDGRSFYKNGYEDFAQKFDAGDFKDLASTYIDTFGNAKNPLTLTIEKTDDSKVVSSTELKSDLALPTALKLYNSPLFDEYAATLYRFASIIAKADGDISKAEEDKLKIIYQLTHNPIPEDVNTSLSISDINKNESLDDVLNELDTLIGLEGVKQEIKSLINYIKIQKEREKAGLKSTQVSYHVVFTGSPGTGKTTIARIVAKIYMHLGILKKGNFVETDRSGLVAEYTGQTAVKVNQTVNSALDGVLFIDEAYSLVGENKDDFGKEAIATLIKRMEDDRDKLIVILAGYTEEMKSFIETNPGFKSRFNRYIEFTDYQPGELESIFKLQCGKLDYKLSKGAEIRLINTLTQAFENRDKSFGNGRYVRNVFEKTIEAQANRIASMSALSKEILTTIAEEDIPQY